MKQAISALLLVLLLVVAPLVSAVGIGGDIPIIINPEQFAPRVFMAQESRIVLDDYNEPGAVSGGEQEMCERVQNYAFEGEQIQWDILVWDKNGVEKIKDVYVQLRQNGQTVDYIEANCVLSDKSCLEGVDVWEGEEHITEFKARTMRWYTCTFTVETPASMHGQYKVVAGAEDLTGLKAEAAESEYWFFNPVIALGINGQMNFGTVRPGATVKSTTLTIGNAAEAGSGVMLDMFIAGTDFYDPSHSGAMCPDSNVLRLSNFKYYASNGAYNTCRNNGVQVGATWVGTDAECYTGIPYYMTGAGAPANNNMRRIIDGTSLLGGVYPAGNVLSPGAELSINFKLSLPEPCNGNSFSQGQIKIFGEAV